MRGDAEKMRPVVPFRRSVPSEANVGFVDQCRALKGVLAAFPLKVVVCQATKFVVNEGK